LTDIDVIEEELAEYGGLADRPRLVALNKTDVARDMADLVRASIEERGLSVYETSVATGDGVQALKYAIADAVRAARASMPEPEPTRIVLRPAAVDDAGFTVAASGDGFVVRGERVERWVKQTNFDNDEAVGYLADRLARIGVEAELQRLGAEPGAEVTIGDWTFDWEPSTEGYQPTRRGEDNRL
jgi:GTP-binding protein